MVPNIRKPGEQLRDIRLRLGITVREVAEESQKIAELEANPEFAISNPWLSQLENSSSVPSIFKLYSLSSIYRFKFTDLVALFGVDLQRLPQRQLAARLPNTHLVTVEDPDPERTVSFPIQFDRGFNLDNTNLLSRMVEIWGDVPIALIQRLDIRHGKYGYIGLQDLSMYPLLRPGSFVQIDTELRKFQAVPWRTEYDRPIYFVELRDGYACSWCEIQDRELLLMPHPLSHCKIRRFVYGAEAEIVGRVTAVAMRLNDPAGPSDSTAVLPKRT
jgi:transcriptional regulator with XRE-family HTH domain